VAPTQVRPAPLLKCTPSVWEQRGKRGHSLDFQENVSNIFSVREKAPLLNSLSFRKDLSIDDKRRQSSKYSFH
jgi:hypothetical protein